MNRFLRSFIKLSIIGLLLVSCRAIAPGGEKTQNKTADIRAFVDTNRNGKWDKGESVLTDVLVAARSNIHGTFTVTAQLTEANGETSITTSYTHYFNLLAFPPCGYEATTPLSVEAKRKVTFGFAPVEPESGIADFHILLWHDKNQDGEYQTGEMPLAGEILYLDPGLNWGGYEPDVFTGQLFAQTDSGGKAEANFGNSCGEVTITIPAGWQPSQTDDEGIWEDGQYRISYQPGRTNIYLGVIPAD